MIWIAVLLLVGLGIMVCSIISAIRPRQGTVSSVSDLQTVYSDAGPQIAATFTNSLIQKFPFAGPVVWTRYIFKEPTVVLTGGVDTNAMHQFISDHPDTRFLWWGTKNESEEGWPSTKDYPTTTWTNIWFRMDEVVEGYEATIEGKINFQSRIATVESYGSDEPVTSRQ